MILQFNYRKITLYFKYNKEDATNRTTLVRFQPICALAI